jgi:hypothetical protein
MSFSLCVKEYKIPNNTLDATRELCNGDVVRTPHVWNYATALGEHKVENFGSTEPSIWHVDCDYHEIVNFIGDCIVDYSALFMEGAPPCFSAIRFNRYEVDQGMQQHVDHIFGLFPDGNPRGIPVISVVGLVDKAEEGGNFIMTYPDGTSEEFLKESGSLILFPSCYIYKHEVKKVTKGIRDSFVSWVHF